MSPRLPGAPIGQTRLSITSSPRLICLFCSKSRALRSSTGSRRQEYLPLPHNNIRRRQQTSAASASIIYTSSSKQKPTPQEISKPPRVELRNALVDLQKHAANYVNIWRLQLAVRGLDETPGDETIKIAVLGLADGGRSFTKAKELLRLLLADPLKAEEEWERILMDDQSGSKPFLLKIGQHDSEDSFQGNRLVQEIKVSSPTLNGHKLEILVLEVDPLSNADSGFEEVMLVPTIDVPISNTGRYTPIMTPVHKSIVVGEGLLGAASVLNFPSNLDRDIISTAVDLKYAGADDDGTPPLFQVINTTLGTKAVQSFRESIDNAILYEKSWFLTGIPEIKTWMGSGTSSSEGSTKLPLLKLINSLLKNAESAIQAEQSRQLSTALASKISTSEVQSLKQGLSQWAEKAHTELRDQLDIAFNGNRWKKLVWWKLFWRVDDISMITTDILAQRFLSDAEKEAIFLAGRIVEAGVIPDEEPKNWAYKPVQVDVPEVKVGVAPPPPQIKHLVEPPKDTPIRLTLQPWPLHIPATRAYLSQETIPALQALAQKLVFQTLSTSSLASVLGGLMYLSSVSTGLYEAGAVTALGIVWSLKRMQGKWEAAREFWEGEVREEGRKAVRGAEGAVAEVLAKPDKPAETDIELEKAQAALDRATTAMENCK